MITGTSFPILEYEEDGCFVQKLHITDTDFSLDNPKYVFLEDTRFLPEEYKSFLSTGIIEKRGNIYRFQLNKSTLFEYTGERSDAIPFMVDEIREFNKKAIIKTSTGPSGEPAYVVNYRNFNYFITKEIYDRALKDAIFRVEKDPASNEDILLYNDKPICIGKGFYHISSEYKTTKVLELINDNEFVCVIDLSECDSGDKTRKSLILAGFEYDGELLLDEVGFVPYYVGDTIKKNLELSDSGYISFRLRKFATRSDVMRIDVDASTFSIYKPEVKIEDAPRVVADIIKENASLIPRGVGPKLKDKIAKTQELERVSDPEGLAGKMMSAFIPEDKSIFVGRLRHAIVSDKNKTLERDG